MKKLTDESMTPVEAFYLLEAQTAMNALHDTTYDDALRAQLEQNLVLEEDAYYRVYSCLCFEDIAKQYSKVTGMEPSVTAELSHIGIPLTYVNYLKYTCIKAMLNFIRSKDTDENDFWRESNWLISRYTGDREPFVITASFILDMECSSW